MVARKKNVKIIKSKKPAQAAEREFGSFELAADTVKFFFQNKGVYMPLVLMLSLLLIPAFILMPEKGHTAGIIQLAFFAIFSLTGVLAVFLGYQFFIFITDELSRHGNRPIIGIGEAVKKTFARMWRYIWTGIIVNLAVLLNLIICLLLPMIAINVLDVGKPVAMVFLIPGLYMFFALYFAPVISLVDEVNRKHPVKASRKLTGDNMLTVFFALLAGFITILAALAAYGIALSGVFGILNFLHLTWLVNILSNIAGVFNFVLLSAMTAITAIHVYKLYKKLLVFAA